MGVKRWNANQTLKQKEGFLFAPIKPVTWLIVYANQAIYI